MKDPNEGDCWMRAEKDVDGKWHVTMSKDELLRWVRKYYEIDQNLNLPLGYIIELELSEKWKKEIQ